MLFEMLYGSTPFDSDDDTMGIYRNIMKNNPTYPATMSVTATGPDGASCAVPADGTVTVGRAATGGLAQKTP